MDQDTHPRCGKTPEGRSALVTAAHAILAILLFSNVLWSQCSSSFIGCWVSTPPILLPGAPTLPFATTGSGQVVPLPSPPFPLPPLPGVPLLYNSCVPVFALSGGAGAANPNDPCQRNDNDSTAAVSLPFAFDLFGQTYTEAYVNNNGNVTFAAPLHQGTPIPLGTLGLPPVIAPFWADADTRLSSSGVVHVQAGATGYGLGGTPALGVTWDHVGYFPQQADKRNTFQVVLTDSFNSDLPLVPNGGGRHFNVAFLYNDMQWTTGDGSGGQNGFGGTGALVGVSLNGVAPNYSHAIGQFSQAGSSLANGGIGWLKWRAIYMDVSVYPPVVEIHNQVPDVLLVIGDRSIQLAITPNAMKLVTSIISLQISGGSQEFLIPNDPAIQGASLFAQVGFYEPTSFPQQPLQLSHGLLASVGMGSLPYGDGGSPVSIGLSGTPVPGQPIRLYYYVPGL